MSPAAASAHAVSHRRLRGLAALLGTATICGSLGCGQEHRIGSAGFRSQRRFDPQLVGWQQPALAAGDLDGDGRADLAILDQARSRLCLLFSQADDLASAQCHDLSTDDAPQHVTIAGWASGEPAQLVLAGERIALYPPLRSAPLPAPTFRVPLPRPARGLLRQDLSRPAAAEHEVIWTFDDTPRLVAWAASVGSAERSAKTLQPSEYSLLGTPSAVLPQRTATGQRALFVATDRGIEHLRSTGDRSTLPCPEQLSNSLDLALADPNADSLLDLLALGTYGTTRLLQQTSTTAAGTWTCTSQTPAPLADQPLLQLLSADFDGDGRIDLAAPSPDRDRGLLLWRSGRPVQSYPQPMPIQAATLAFLDSDARVDVVLLLRDGTLQLLYNTFSQ